MTLLGLLVATAAAFAITEHLKLIKSPISGATVPKAFSPVCGCATAKASIRIKLRHSDWLTVSIEDSSRRTVDTLATHVHRQKGYATFLWDGKTDTGGRISSGTYQAQVKLATARWTILLPNKIQVDTTVPKVLLAFTGRHGFVPGAKRTIHVQYSLSEAAHPVVYLGGTRIILGRRTRTRSEIKWNGRKDHAALPQGRYVLEIGALDLAGNVTPPGERKRVVVRLLDVALPQGAIYTRVARRFRAEVQSVSGAYRWWFAGKHGTAHGAVLRLTAPSRHGRYGLVVVGRHHQRATASVIVRRK